MKLKEHFLLSELAGQWVLIPVGEAAGKMVALNKTGAYLTQLLQQDATREELTAALLERYAVDASTAEKDVDRLLAALAEADALESK